MFDIEKKLSEIALDDVLEVRSDTSVAKEYKTLAKGFGSRIMNNTLLGAMAFLASKAGPQLKGAHGKLFEHIIHAIKVVYPDVGWKEKYANPQDMYRDVFDYLSQPDAITNVMYIQELATQYITYLRRYVSAFIEGGSEE